MELYGLFSLFLFEFFVFFLQVDKVIFCIFEKAALDIYNKTMHMMFPTTKNSPEVTPRKYMLTFKVPISTIADDILKKCFL